MTTKPRPTPLPYETGTTAGGGLLAAPGAFFRRFCKGADTPTRTTPPRSLFADQLWQVIYERPNGDVATEAVLINGGCLMADIDTLARRALRDQRDIDCATIIRIQIDYRATPARINLLDRITRTYNSRRRFEADCG